MPWLVPLDTPARHTSARGRGDCPRRLRTVCQKRPQETRRNVAMPAKRHYYTTTCARRIGVTPSSHAAHALPHPRRRWCARPIVFFHPLLICVHSSLKGSGSRLARRAVACPSLALARLDFVPLPLGLGLGFLLSDVYTPAECQAVNLSSQPRKTLVRAPKVGEVTSSAFHLLQYFVPAAGSLKWIRGMPKASFDLGPMWATRWA